MAPSAWPSLLAAAARPDVLSFAVGTPAPCLLPVRALADAAARVLAEVPCRLLYEPPAAALKEHVVRLMAERGVDCGPEQVFLTSGAQQGISCLARLLTDPGGTLITETLTYSGVRLALEPLRPAFLTVGTDPGTGMRVDEIERLLRGGARPAFIYTIPEGHNPLGVRLGAEERRRMVELARHHGVPVVEDDAYGHLCYDDAALPALRALDAEWVYHVGSFSKLLGPAFRLGWVVVPERLTPHLTLLKEGMDLSCASFSQHVAAAYLDQGLLPAHLAALRGAFQLRRDAMLAAFGDHLPQEVRWNTPLSGLFCWLELPAGIDAAAVLADALATERVAFAPGAAFGVGGGGAGSNGMRLAFSGRAPDEIGDGVARVGQVLRRALAGGTALA